MTEDFSQLEEQLRALTPAEPGHGLERRVAAALRAPSRTGRTWWERLGFYHPAAAFGWGVVTPSAAAVVAVTLFQVATAGTPAGNGTDGSEKSPPKEAVAQVATTNPAVAQNSVAVASTGNGDAADTVSQIQGGAASTLVYETSDEGVVLNGDQQPARRVRYLSEDTLTWRNPRTGADIEVSYPREEIVLTPIAAR